MNYAPPSLSYDVGKPIGRYPEQFFPHIWLQLTRRSLRRDEYLAKLQIEQFAQMPENWDGYGALPISDRTMINAVAALHRLSLIAPVPDITPNPNGTLSFEWETDHGTGHLEIGQTKLSFYIKPSHGPAFLLDGLTDNIEALAIDIGGAVVHRLFPETTNTSTTVMSLSINVSYTH